MKYVLAVLVAFVSSYLGMAYILWEGNPHLWTEEARLLSLFMAFALLIPVLGIASESGK